VLGYRSTALQKGFESGVLKIMVLHGGGKLNYLLTQLRDSLASTHAFLDNDEQGRAAAEAADGEGLLGIADRTMAMCPGAKRDSEFEDLVDPSIYRQGFLSEFGVKVEDPWTKQLSKGKWSKRMPTVFAASGTEWSDAVESRAKHIVAAAVAANPDSALKTSCDGVIDALVETLESKLAQRLK
jgi:putative ATP-dependent endonuclease of the OLD family